MLVNDTPLDYALVIAAKYAAGYVGLGCVLYFIIALFIGGVPAISTPFSILVEVYGLIEILWYMLWFLPYKVHLQKPGLRTAASTRPERKALIEMSLDQVPDTRLFLRKWFGNAHLDEICQYTISFLDDPKVERNLTPLSQDRDDVKDWLLSFLWATDSDAGIDADELDEYIELIEQKADLTLFPGRAGAKPIRPALDPVQVSHRSLLFYAAIALIDITAVLRLKAKGFQFYAQPRASFFQVFPLRPMTLFPARRSASPHLSYLYRPHTSKTHRPVVFCHGVGTGLSPYIAWLDTIPRDVGVLALENLPASMRLCPDAATLAPAEFRSAMMQIFAQQNITDFVLVGHSYGTLLMRPLLDDPVLAAMVRALVLCDPAALLAYLPDAAYNLTQRTPRTAPELQVRELAALDPGFARVLARSGPHWSEYGLSREDLLGRRATVVVAGRDCVLDANAIAGHVYYGHVKYLASADIEELRGTPELWTGQAEGPELIYLHDRDHGQCLRVPAEMRRVANVVERYARLDPGADPRSEEKVGSEKEQNDADRATVGSRSSQVSAANFV